MGENYHDLKRLARSLGSTPSAKAPSCPNIGECWHHKTATFMMLGNLCTRRCGFCAVPKGRPEPIDFDEPRRVAEAVATLGLEYAVITSVNRDDDLLGGARVFAMVIEEIRRQAPGCRVEVLIPDFQGNQEAIRTVVEARPEVLNHNTETVPRLYRVVRSGARYERSLELLRYAKELSPAGSPSPASWSASARRPPSCSRSSAIWPRSTATSSPSASICAPRATTCPWRASTRRASSPS